jgi:hypothetical protein
LARRVGRPSQYKPEFAEQARKFCLLGATNDRLAEFFGVAASTLDNWIKDKPDFAEAVKAGRAVADAEVAHSLYRRATGYSHRAVKLFLHEGRVIEHEYTEVYPPDATSMIFWLKNRDRENWRDKVDHSHSVDDDMLKAFDAACERAKKR